MVGWDETVLQWLDREGDYSALDIGRTNYKYKLANGETQAQHDIVLSKIVESSTGNIYLRCSCGTIWRDVREKLVNKECVSNIRRHPTTAS